jgi:DNA-binding IclR family transcriptional regulator
MSISKTGKVPAVDRAFSTLELLAASNGGLSISTVARRLKVPKSSIHLIMTALEDRGYLRKDAPSRKYFVGLRFTDLATAALKGFELRERSKPVLMGLSAKIGLTVHLAVLEGSEAVLIERIESPGMAQLDTWVGQRMHVNCTAVGKALLACLSEEEFKRLIHGRRLIKHNQYTICSIAKLRDELNRIRATGYAVDNEEEEIGVRCIGAPIYDHTGKAIAAISAAGTTVHIPQERIEKLAKYVTDTAKRISLMLGYLVPL